MEDRHRLGREEIGILLSFAKRPEIFTDEWVDRLQRGVTTSELTEFFASAGLPERTAAQIAFSNESPHEHARSDWEGYGHGFRRVTAWLIVIGIAIFLVPGFQSADPFSYVGRVLAAAVVGLLLYSVIVRLAPGMRPSRGD